MYISQSTLQFGVDTFQVFKNQRRLRPARWEAAATSPVQSAQVEKPSFLADSLRNPGQDTCGISRQQARTHRKLPLTNPLTKQ